MPYDPTNEVDMRALCKQWTEGSPAAFAVLDGIGTWQDQDQLCITQEGHTPLISAWSSVTDWTNTGSPYLWWTGADQAAILNTVVHWGLSTGRIHKSKPLGIVVGDLTSDLTALNHYLLPDLKSLGVTKVDVEEIASQTSEAAATTTDATLAVERLKAAGVTTVLPMLRLNALFPYLAAEGSQEYYPTLLLSDYESEIQIGLGLIPIPFEKELNGQEGITTLTLGGIDDNRPESEGGYDPAVRKCWEEWIAKYPGPLNRNFIEEQGPIAAWCGVIDLVRHRALGTRERTSTAARSWKRWHRHGTYRARGSRPSASVPTSSTGRPSTGSSRSTTTFRRVSAPARNILHHRGRVG